MSLITASVHQCKRVQELLAKDAASMNSGSADVYCTKHFERGSGQSYRALKGHLVDRRELR